MERRLAVVRGWGTEAREVTAVGYGVSVWGDKRFRNQSGGGCITLRIDTLQQGFAVC